MTKTTFDINADVIKLQGEIFVIPNRAIISKDEFSIRMERRIKEVCELNNVPFNAESSLIGYFWIILNDYRCGSLSDIDVMIENDGDWYYIQAPNKGYFPLSLFEGKVEGDIVNVKIPIEISDVDGKKINELQAILTLKLNQKDYRNRSGYFSRFEEAIKYIKEV